MYAYPSEGFSSQRQHPPPPRPQLSVPGPIHTQHHSIGYTPTTTSAATPSSTLSPSHNQAPPRMPHRQEDLAPTVPRGTGPSDYSTKYEGRIYSLKVVQQPIRARMCGFGDKDRRPITPPPCIKLTIIDELTGKEISPNEVDTSFYVLTVDLWDATGTEEQNLVRNPGGSPAPTISASVQLTYPHTMHNADGSHGQQQGSGYYSNGYSNPSDPRYSQQPPSSSHYSSTAQYGANSTSNYNHPSSNGYSYSHGYPPSSPYSQSSPLTPSGPFSQNMMGPPMQARDYVTTPSTATSSTSGPPVYNRNLIGSLSASAFQLQDDEGKWGIWFIMQDLSVRQEGTFRLKMSFVDVGNTSNRRSLHTAPALAPSGLKTTAPVLASCFSEPFQVFSAKRFPGVIESTALSKCFATQGIKIPIRQNDGNKRAHASDDEDDDQ